MKILKPGFRARDEMKVLQAPVEADTFGVEGLARQNQSLPIGIGQAIVHQGQIKILIASVELLANERMAGVGQMDPNLVFATGLGLDLQ
jgi:hypothetical protein